MGGFGYIEGDSHKWGEGYEVGWNCSKSCFIKKASIKLSLKREQNIISSFVSCHSNIPETSIAVLVSCLFYALLWPNKLDILLEISFGNA